MCFLKNAIKKRLNSQMTSSAVYQEKSMFDSSVGKSIAHKVMSYVQAFCLQLLKFLKSLTVRILSFCFRFADWRVTCCYGNPWLLPLQRGLTHVGSVLALGWT